MDIYPVISFLLKVVEILKEETREIDDIGRIGGDEFCIFMKNIFTLEYVKRNSRKHPEKSKGNRIRKL